MDGLMDGLLPLGLGVALGFAARDLYGRWRRRRHAATIAADAARLRAAREQGDRARLQFLAVMSHEMRTPLNGVVGAVDLLRRTKLDRRQGELVELALASTRTLRDLLSDILDYTLLSSGQLALEREPLKLEQVVDDVAEELIGVARAKRVSLSVAHDPGVLKPVLGDHRRLRQLIGNLVDNAIKFTDGSAEQPGQISISLQRDAGPAQPGEVPVLITVKDNGSGIDPALLDQVREPFRAGDMTASRSQGGTGLGLAIVEGLADLMHGRIEIQSRPIAGTQVRVHLRLPEASADPITVLRPLDGRRYALRIGDPGLAATVRRYLEHAGATVLGDDPTGAATDAALIADARLVGLPSPRTLALVREGEIAPHGVVGIKVNPLRRTALIDALARLDPGLGRGGVASIGAPSAALPPAPVAEAAPEVLVVEDNVFNQRVIKLQLEQLGIAVELAANGNAGLEAWQARQHPFILCDLHMPQMDGFEMVRRLRHDAASSGLRPVIVAVSADALASTPEACLRAGFDGYLAKPVQLEELRSVIARWQPNLLRRKAPPT